jgi:hypothetical protein
VINMIVKINGATIDKPLLDRFNEVVEKVEKEIATKNRAVRRSKTMKGVMAFLGMIVPLGTASIAHATTLNPAPDTEKMIIGGWLFDKLKNDLAVKAKGGIFRGDSVAWHMNDWLQHALLHTEDFFDNAQVVGMFSTIWTICMSFVMIIISKKGFDMVKARVLGSSSLGATELIIRLLACVVMTFFSLDIMQLGIQGSNLVIKTLFKALESNLVPYDVLKNTGGINVVFWFIGFSFMTIVLSIQYWVRQITVTILGVLTPVATLSWVVDGGAMLGTLIREFVTLITTPLIHGIILTIGTIFIRELVPVTGHAWLDAFNTVMIGFSTMFLMIVTPSFLRKFTTGTANPFKTVGMLGKGTYGSAMKLVNLIKR